MHNFYRYKFIPQNYIAEEVLLGIILIYPKIIHKIKSQINREIFFIEKNKILYSQIINTVNTKDNNIIQLLYKVEYINKESKINSIYRMIQLMKKSKIFISSYKTNKYLENIIHILNIIYVKRLIIQLGYNTIKLGHLINIKNQYLCTKLSYYIQNIEKEIKDNKKNHIGNIKEFISQEILGSKYINKDNRYDRKPITINSGILSLDKLIKCLPAGNLITIAGRPSIGKTSLSINIAYNCFLKKNISLLIFSLEMTSKQIFNKFIKISSNNKINNITKEYIESINNKNWEKLSKICHILIKQNIYINEESKLNIDQIEFIASNLKRNQFIRLIIIDYLQLIEININKKINNNRSQEIGYITRRLKLLAQYLKIPIILISQLNRNIENRQQKEPLLSDLKESGCIISDQNININKRSLNIANIEKNHIYLKKIIKKRLYVSNKILKNKTSMISILNKKNFKYFIKEKNIVLTYNHKYLHKVNWVKSKQILKINQIFNNMNLIKLKKYIQHINFNKEFYTYDINKYNYFIFFINQTILHNSIEQDSDIIIILYEINDMKYHNQTKENKIIDLKVSKNRNGNTGYCKLNFEPYSNIFTDKTIKNIIGKS
uniref:Replication helicase subunit n=1 Tax=Erythrocystis saccata TaxID=2822695 RepID=A0A8E6L3F4_9FLOR|nr:Replication helicase subunit [Erythrocystis saccata]